MMLAMRAPFRLSRILPIVCLAIAFALFDSGDDLAGFPEGLELTSNGVISGTPTRTGLFQFDVKVQDSSVSPQHGGPQWYVVRLYLRIR